MGARCSGINAVFPDEKSRDHTGKKLSPIESTYILKVGKLNSIFSCMNDGAKLSKFQEEHNLLSVKFIQVSSTIVVCMETMVPSFSDDVLQRTLVVAWRGTTSLEDVKHDIDALLFRSFIDSGGNMVGQAGDGYLDAYDLIRNKDDSSFALDMIQQLNSLPGGLIVTGHSLGGALAILTAVDIFSISNGKVKPKVVTFGNPKVFDAATAETVKKMDLEMYRCVNFGDDIPSVPFTHFHVGIPIFKQPKICEWCILPNVDFDGIPDLNVSVASHVMKSYIERLEEYVDFLTESKK